MKKKKVKVTIDRPFGSVHPKHSNIVYPLNYGYVDGIMGGRWGRARCLCIRN